MLRRDTAQAQLQNFYSSDWRSQRIQQLSTLPDEVRTIGYGILGHSAEGQSLNIPDYYEVQAQSYQQLDQLAPAERLSIFNVLFPHFAVTVEAAWQLIGQLPYQSGYSRRSFRTPTRPEYSATKRYQWLQQLIGATEGYDQNLEWFAVWTPYLGYYAPDVLGVLFAAALNQNDALGQSLFEVLTASASSNHDIGAMGRHVTRALLVANRPAGWDFIERLLLAAQRQEGLRQTILETIDEAHPIAFKRMLQLILEHKLTRFSATVRAVGVWFGFGLDALNEPVVKQLISQALELLDHPHAQELAQASEDPQLVYLALWAAGFSDAVAAIDRAAPLLNHPQATHRFVAVHFLAQLELTPARLLLLSAISDCDVRVATAAVQALVYTNDPIIQQSDVFERLEQVLPHFPAKPQTRSMVWEWTQLKPSQTLVASALLHNLGERSPKRLIPYLSRLEPHGRSTVAQLLSDVQPWDAEIRSGLFHLLADASSWVRERVIQLLQSCDITATESIELEQLLTRTASDLRRGVLGLLLRQADEAAIASAERLLVAKKAPQRQAGLELLLQLVQQNRLPTRAQHLAREYQASAKLTTAETQLLTRILQSETEATLTNALGLVEVAALTPIVSPQVVAATQIITPAAVRCRLALDDLIHEHRQTPVQFTENSEEELLGNITWRFPRIDLKRSPEENLERLPLSDVWLNWWHDRSDLLRDVDGLELVRAIAPRLNHHSDQPRETESTQPASLIEQVVRDLQAHVGQPQPPLRYPHQIDHIIRWLLYLHPPEQLFDYCLDAIATLLNTIPMDDLKHDPQWRNPNHWGISSQVSSFVLCWIQFARPYSATATSEQLIRWWHLVRWVDHCLLIHYFLIRQSVTLLWDVYSAYQLGAATDDDLMFFLLGAEEHNEETAYLSSHVVAGNASEAKANLRTSFPDLSQLTRRNVPEFYAAHPFLLELADRARQRILTIELQRGDLPTAASNAARALKSIVGMTTVIQLIQAFDCTKLVRHFAYNNLSKPAVFSHLMRISFPATDDTPAEFSQRIQSAQIKPDQLIQCAFYAPQWATHIEQALGWAGFAEAVWWFHAHTKDNGWSVEQDVRETWAAQISERTPLSAQSLMDGAVDVDWFHRIYTLLGADRWNQLYDAAQYAASGAGHQRAKLFADAMLGNVTAESLRDRIAKKRYQDAVRALGLLPLPNGNTRDADILARYQALQEFLRTSKQFGSQRQASEKLAVSIGMENLARTAGFIDPQRLQWAMEAEAIADLVGQAQTVTIDQVSVSLTITAKGEPEITVTKQGKPLKSIPAKLKQQAEIKALTSRKQGITQQASRIRVSLEQAMCRGDRFTATELAQLAAHPVLFPMLGQLVLIGNCEIGYLVEHGTALQNHSQVITPIASNELRIAHAHDLLMTQEWHLWQQECFESDRVQPFKQIFRELYVPTPAEQSETTSHRYEGHQVNPKQALALWGQRGWVAAPEEGVRRTFHTEGLIAEVSFLDGFYSPLEVEGLTIAGVQFRPRDRWQPLPLNQVPPRLFSEVMRDLDLVVSVAHQGGVDPEATASTVEMRAALVRETCRLLKLSNVQIQGTHVLIEGYLSSYSVHLGSAIVHRQPGGALCIVPVHSQHRGRLFLPFVDSDPKTAEVVSKVLLLSRDQDIQDPTILQQIL